MIHQIQTIEQIRTSGLGDRDFLRRGQLEFLAILTLNLPSKRGLINHYGNVENIITINPFSDHIHPSYIIKNQMPINTNLMDGFNISTFTSDTI